MNLKYSVLGLLHYKNLHGYRIREHIERQFGNMWTINPGQIYPVLKKLEDDDLITLAEVSQNENKGPYRKLYAITDKGKEEFQRWLSSTPENGAIIRDPFLTRFVFFRFGSREQALELIDEQIALYEAKYQQRQSQSEHLKQQNIYVSLVVELGITYHEMVLEWLKYAREEIMNQDVDNS